MATPPKLKTPVGAQPRTAPKTAGKSMCGPFSLSNPPSPSFSYCSFHSLQPYLTSSSIPSLVLSILSTPTLLLSLPPCLASSSLLLLLLSFYSTFCSFPPSFLPYPLTPTLFLHYSFPSTLPCLFLPSSSLPHFLIVPLLMPSVPPHHTLLLHVTPILPSAAPFRIPLAMSPLIVIQTPLSVQGNNKTPTRPPHQVSRAQDTENQDVSSPSAARERVNTVNQDSVIRTPATIMIGRKTPALSLQRAVLLSTGTVHFILNAPEGEGVEVYALCSSLFSMLFYGLHMSIFYTLNSE